MLTTGFIINTLSNHQVVGWTAPVSRVVIDSRLAQPGSLFVAFSGSRVDGHDYVADAYQRGAVAALVERPVEAGLAPLVDTRLPSTPQPSTPVSLLVDNTLAALQKVAQAWHGIVQTPVIGITGSVGKTTTKELTHAVLSQRFNVLKSTGSYNNEIGLPLTLLQLRSHHQRAVLEMGMYTPGDISLLCQLAHPTIGVVTNVGPVHLERAGTMEAIVAAKRELVEALPPHGTAILNRDDDRVMSMAPFSRAGLFTYGLDGRADLWADNITSMGLDGIRFILHYGAEALTVHVPLLGRHSVHTALRAAAVGLVEGLSWEEIIHGLQSLEGQLRLVAIPGPKDSILIDDTYNSSPESAIAALNLLQDLDGRRLAVLGDMLELGSAEEESHRLVGQRVRDVAHILVTVGSRARLIAEEARRVGMPDIRVHAVDEVDQAVGLLEKIIADRDVILIKGSHGARLDTIVSALSRN